MAQGLGVQGLGFRAEGGPHLSQIEARGCSYSPILPA